MRRWQVFALIIKLVKGIIVIKTYRPFIRFFIIAIFILPFNYAYIRSLSILNLIVETWGVVAADAMDVLFP